MTAAKSPANPQSPQNANGDEDPAMRLNKAKPTSTVGTVASMVRDDASKPTSN